MADPAFDLVVVGSGGGPDETDLSAYLLKPHNTAWDAGIIALEAGSGQGTLSNILARNRDLFNTDSLSSSPSPQYSAAKIYSFVYCYLVTHAHLDHINSLVISAGAVAGPRKRIYAVKETLQDLEHIFSDRIWPNLASWDEDDDEHKYLYSALNPNGKYHIIFPQVSVQVFPINHGTNNSGHYSSAAFFIRSDSDPSKREFLFFGDVEPDSITANTPRTINVWRTAAPKIPQTLSTIFIECSWPSERPNEMLYGHLSPEHLRDELVVLATEVHHFRTRESSGQTTRARQRKRQKRNPVSSEDLRGVLSGVRLYIIHCKSQLDRSDGVSIKDLITQQVRMLVDAEGLGIEILTAVQGMHIRI